MNSCRGVGLPRQSRGELEVPGRPARPRRQDTSIRLRRIVQSNAAHHGLDVLALGLGRRPGLARCDVPFKLEMVLRRVARRAANRARPARPGTSPRVDPPTVAPAAPAGASTGECGPRSMGLRRGCSLEAHGHRLDILGNRNVAARVPIAPPLRRRAARHDGSEHRRRRRCVVCVHRRWRRARVVGSAVVHPWVRSVRRRRRISFWRVRLVRVPTTTRSLYSRALYTDDCPTLDDLREAVTTLEETARTARRVLGSRNPLTPVIEHDLRKSRAALRARETPSI